MQSLLLVLKPPVGVALRRHSSGFSPSPVQHCAAMDDLSGHCHSTRPTDELTASSPGHKQKLAFCKSSLPAKMATPDSGMVTRGGGGSDGDGKVARLEGMAAGKRVERKRQSNN